MFKIAMTVAAIMASAGAARADDTPVTTQQGCFNMVDGLAQNYENYKGGHKYTNKAQTDKIEVALSALEKQCQDNAFAEAQKAAAGLKSELSPKP